jgi:hypothetical protein
MHVMPLQGGSMQVPLLQYGWPATGVTHECPQVPQLWMSFSSLTHWPLQHVRPPAQGNGQTLPLELDELDAVVVDEDELDVVPLLDDVVVMPLDEELCAPPVPPEVDVVAELVVCVPPTPPAPLKLGPPCEPHPKTATLNAIPKQSVIRMRRGYPVARAAHKCERGSFARRYGSSLRARSRSARARSRQASSPSSWQMLLRRR